MKRIAILGSTGSIGVNALDIIRRNPSRFKVVALSAGRNTHLLKDQIEEFLPKIASVIDDQHATQLSDSLGRSNGTSIRFGTEGYREVAAIGEADMVISAMVGSAGLIPTLEAIAAGKDIALANKETMVMAGNLVLRMAKEKGVAILPVDSEHSAIFQCLVGHRHQDIRRIILTASGGPFLKMSREELSHVKPAQALKHPNWEMGKKITIDSASMMNKGLEVIEAKWLFDVDYDDIHVQIHPQSIIHSMVEYIDGSVVAQLGCPDMRIPIAYALSYPERFQCPAPPLDLLKVGALEFIKPDFDKFPNLRLAYEAGRTGGTMPAVLNGANEVAVEAFLEEKIGFTDMTAVIEKTIANHQCNISPTIDDILAADLWAKEEVKRIIEGLKL
jgi:1-deoxy-D-xylulose-5-phosphate reductoisomerase